MRINEIRHLWHREHLTSYIILLLLLKLLLLVLLPLSRQLELQGSTVMLLTQKAGAL